jgi:23S rRNA (cytidine1920-2'-O)/16S rRNA (cytidine1409-2'-O)-methyltransferase
MPVAVGWRRLDMVMVESGMATSRSHAARLIADGSVTVDGWMADKAARKVPPDALIRVANADLVGRGGLKLRGALDAFGFSVAGKRCLDIGASTGGFTQALLERGAERVVAIDVGHDQLDPRLVGDPRVENHEGINARHLQEGDFGNRFPVVVGDLSFISLLLVVDGVANVAADDGDVVLLVKPQFEVGKEQVGRTGIVSDPNLHRSAVAGVTRAFELADWHLRETVESPVVGGDGNREFFVWLRKKS